MKTSKTRFARIAGTLAATALLVAACGDDDDTNAADIDTPADVDDVDTAEIDAPADPDSADSDAPAYGDDASVRLAAPADGAEVTSPVSFSMAFENVTVASAGEAVEGEGHMHLLLDGECEEPGTTIPADDTHRHFGDASIVAELELEPGEYTVCLQLADGLHVASDLTDIVSFTVVE